MKNIYDNIIKPEIQSINDEYGFHEDTLLPALYMIRFRQYRPYIFGAYNLSEISLGFLGYDFVRLHRKYLKDKDDIQLLSDLNNTVISNIANIE